MLDKTKNYKIDVSALNTVENVHPAPTPTPYQNAYKGSPLRSKPNKV